MKNTTLRYKLVIGTIYAVLAACFIGLPFSMIAFGSDLKSRQTSLYPYNSVVELQDEFLSGSNVSGSIGSLGWFITGGATSNRAGETNAPGIVRKDTSAVINTVASLLLDGDQTGLVSGSTYNALYRVRLNTNDANTEIRIGMSSTCTVVTTNGIYFEKLSADTNWFAVQNNAGVQTRTDTGVAVNTSFNSFTINKIGTTSTTFTINGAGTTTITTNFPATGIQPCLQITNTAAAAKTFDIDYFQLRVTGLVR